MLLLSIIHMSHNYRLVNVMDCLSTEMCADIDKVAFHLDASGHIQYAQHKLHTQQSVRKEFVQCEGSGGLCSFHAHHVFGLLASRALSFLHDHDKKVL